MATVDKKSLREEFGALKAEFEKLSSEGKMTTECRVLFQAMLMLFEVVLAVFMEKITQKDNANSSIPSSQTEKDESSTGHKGSNSKANEQNDERSSNTRTVESTRVAEVNACDSCGADLSDIPCEQHERRTTIDIMFEKVVEHVDAEIKQCPECETITKGRFPACLCTAHYNMAWV